MVSVYADASLKAFSGKLIFLQKSERVFNIMLDARHSLEIAGTKSWL